MCSVCLFVFLDNHKGAYLTTTIKNNCSKKLIWTGYYNSRLFFSHSEQFVVAIEEHHPSFQEQKKWIFDEARALNSPRQPSKWYFNWVSSHNCIFVATHRCQDQNDEKSKKHTHAWGMQSAQISVFFSFSSNFFVAWALNYKQLQPPRTHNFPGSLPPSRQLIFCACPDNKCEVSKHKITS